MFYTKSLGEFYFYPTPLYTKYKFNNIDFLKNGSL